MTFRAEIFTQQSVGEFPWYRGCHLRIRASGTIWSGVVCTGLTPPGGWGAWPVHLEESDWPCRGGTARRYGLIGSLDEGRSWFFVGTGVAKFATSPPRSDTARVRLLLAVNKPHPEAGVPSDHAWSVEVDTFEPGRDEETCRAVLSELADVRSTNATNACSEIGRTAAELREREHQMDIAFEIAGGFAIALTLVATAPLVVEELAANATQRVAIQALRDALSHALESANPLVQWAQCTDYRHHRPRSGSKLHDCCQVRRVAPYGQSNPAGNNCWARDCNARRLCCCHCNGPFIADTRRKSRQRCLRLERRNQQR